MLDGLGGQLLSIPIDSGTFQGRSTTFDLQLKWNDTSLNPTLVNANVPVSLMELEGWDVQ